MELLKTYKDSYSNHPKEIWALSILGLINRMGTMVMPFLALYFPTHLHFSEVQTGYLLSALGVGMFVGSYIGGKLCEVIGSKLVMILSLFCAGLFLISIQYFFNFYSLLVLMFFTSMLGDAYRPAMFVSVGNFVPKEEMGRTMSLIRLMINVGMALGTAIGGYLAANAGYSWLFWIDGTTCFIAAIFLIFVSKNWANDKNEKLTEVDLKENKAKSVAVYKDKNFLLFLIATFIMGFVFVQWFHTVPYFLKTEWGFGEYYYGMLFSFSCLLIVLIEMPLIHHIEKIKKIKNSLLIGVLLLGASFLLFRMSGALIICFLAISFWTLGEILHLPLNSSEAMNFSTKEKRGTYMAYFWMTWSATAILGPLIGFNYVYAYSFDSFWIILFILSIISLLLFYFAFRNRPSH